MVFNIKILNASIRWTYFLTGYDSIGGYRLISGLVTTQYNQHYKWDEWWKELKTVFLLVLV